MALKVNKTTPRGLTIFSSMIQMHMVTLHHLPYNCKDLSNVPFPAITFIVQKIIFKLQDPRVMKTYYRIVSKALKMHHYLV